MCVSGSFILRKCTHSQWSGADHIFGDETKTLLSSGYGVDQDDEVWVYSLKIHVDDDYDLKICVVTAKPTVEGSVVKLAFTVEKMRFQDIGGWNR